MVTARGIGACGDDNRLLMGVWVTEGGIGGCKWMQLCRCLWALIGEVVTAVGIGG